MKLAVCQGQSVTILTKKTNAMEDLMGCRNDG